jgi:hypothetical protein
MDRVCPAPLDEAIYCGLDDDIPEMKGIQNAGVENRDRRLKHHGAG